MPKLPFITYFFVAIPLLLNPLTLADEGTTSALWGNRGEIWQPGGRLPDYSYAGYHRGEKPLPNLLPEVSVLDFGAVGDGETDDTAAFKQALKEAAGKTIEIPAGRYLITDILEITKTGTVLLGAGPDQTVLWAPKPLEEIRPNMGSTTTGDPTSNYSWSGGVVWARGDWRDKPLAKVTAAAQRGTTSLVVDEPEAFEVGDEVRLTLQGDEQQSLASHLYADDPSDLKHLKPVKQNWFARVTKVDQEEKCLTFDRNLVFDVRLEWSPTLLPAQSSAEEIGIENLAFEFPVTPYGGHFSELGYNAIAFSNLRNSWVRNVEVRHADSGFFIGGANNTLQNIRFHSSRQRDSRRNCTGHHGVTLGGTDLMLEDFEIQTKFIHDITMTRGSASNVVRRGRAEDLTCDHHKYANHSNLYTNLNAGRGTNIFRSGGGAKRGRHAGAWNTWWNIRTRRPVKYPTGWAPEMINIVGVKSNEESQTATAGRWFETISPEQLRPEDLYESQLEKRLGK
ncbi:MAG: glycosyl hydrolase family 28-related protein [Lacipirellulaceae bacterium]